VSLSISPLSLQTIDQLPAHARRCVFWEMSAEAVSSPAVDAAFEKEAWLSMVMLDWGSCGQLATFDGRPAGAALYAPPAFVPRASALPSGPVSPDAVLLTSVHLEPAGIEFDIAADLVGRAISDLSRRGVRAIEAFGRVSDGALWSAAKVGECGPQTCMIPAEFLDGYGFKLVSPHHKMPRYRLEIDRDHEWKQDVEYALDQLLVDAALSMMLESGSFEVAPALLAAMRARLAGAQDARSVRRR
jgi:hypothetical protein